jgi:hypothetical protein
MRGSTHSNGGPDNPGGQSPWPTGNPNLGQDERFGTPDISTI